MQTPPLPAGKPHLGSFPCSRGAAAALPWAQSGVGRALWHLSAPPGCSGLCATSTSLGSVSITHTPTTGTSCAHTSAAKQVKAPQSPSVPKSHLSAPKPSQLPACWGRILHKKFQFLPHPCKDFQPHPFPSSPPTPSLQAARSQMRRPQQSILFPPPRKVGNHRERGIGIMLARGTAWMLWEKAHLEGGAMRGSHAESIPWDGDVDIQGETLSNTI